MFTPICVPCAREMRCRKNGYFFKDYQGAAIWSGDMYACESCNTQVVVGVGREPVVEASSRNFEHAARHSGFELTHSKEGIPRRLHIHGRKVQP
jgi:hypothetical protein